MRETVLKYPPELFRLWKAGRVHRAWYWTFAGLFDKQDLSNCEHQHRDGYHFAEWYSAVHFHTKGFKVLVTKYARKSHARKYREASRLLGKSSMRLLTRSLRKVSPPDLLVFDPRRRSFFFAEIKREKDKLREKQSRLFREIEKKIRCQVLLIKLKASSN